MAKQHVRVKRKSCHLLTSTLGQLPCTLQNTWQLTCSGKKKESCHPLTSTLRQLPCTLQNIWQLAAWVWKEETGVWVRWQMPTHQPLCVNENWRVGELLNVHRPAPSCDETDVWTTG
ncbi:hypothetical protein VPH35_095898 [Triticum aestivum]